jgi:hypothetical protein
VCENLYGSTKKKAPGNSPFSIALNDYLALPQVEVQLEEYLRQKLVEFGQTIQINVGDAEVDRWKDVLSGLSIPQIDGTVVTQLKSKEELRVLARKLGCRLPFEPTMNYLSDPSVRILRGEEVINSVTNLPVWAYSLGHDAIGSVMERWKTIKQERNRRAARFRPTALVLGLLQLAVPFGLVFFGHRTFRFDIFALICFTYAAFFFLVAAFPRLMFVMAPFLARFSKPTSGSGSKG